MTILWLINDIFLKILRAEETSIRTFTVALFKVVNKWIIHVSELTNVWETVFINNGMLVYHKAGWNSIL